MLPFLLTRHRSRKNDRSPSPRFRFHFHGWKDKSPPPPDMPFLRRPPSKTLYKILFGTAVICSHILLCRSAWISLEPPFQQTPVPSAPSSCAKAACCFYAYRQASISMRQKGRARCRLKYRLQDCCQARSFLFPFRQIAPYFFADSLKTSVALPMTTI